MRVWMRNTYKRYTGGENIFNIIYGELPSFSAFYEETSVGKTSITIIDITSEEVLERAIRS